MKPENKILFSLFFLYATLLLVLIFFTGYNGLYGQDAHEYLRYCKSLVSFFKDGNHPANYSLSAGYPLAGALLGLVTTPHAAMLLIPVLCAAWIVVIVAAYLMNEFPGREYQVAFYSFLFLGMSPYFFRYAVSVIPDIPAIAFLVTAYYFADRYVKLHRNRFFYFAVFNAMMALFIRLAIAPLLVPIFVFIFLNLISKFELKKLAGVVIIILVPALIYFYLNGNDALGFFNHFELKEWSVTNYFKRNFLTPDGIVNYSLPNLIFVLSSFIHPGLIFCGSLFVGLMWYNKNQPSMLFKPLVIACVIYMLFISGMPFQKNRFLVPILPLFIVMCFPSYLTILAWFHYKRKALYLLTFSVLVIQIILVYSAFQPFYKANQEQMTVAEMMLK